MTNPLITFVPPFRAPYPLEPLLYRARANFLLRDNLLQVRKGFKNKDKLDFQIKALRNKFGPSGSIAFCCVVRNKTHRHKRRISVYGLDKLVVFIDLPRIESSSEVEQKLTSLKDAVVKRARLVLLTPGDYHKRKFVKQLPKR